MTTEATIAALEQELVFAKQLAPGGQTTDPGRVAAIEDQIKAHKRADKTPAEKPENQSNVSTDYQSHDADAGKSKASKSKAEHARDSQSKPETADETEERETADA